MDEEGEELLEAGWYIRGAGDGPGCTIARGLEKQDAGTLAPPQAAVEAGGPEGCCCSLWVPSDREEMSVGGGGYNISE